jgi:hypothetical protein
MVEQMDKKRVESTVLAKVKYLVGKLDLKGKKSVVTTDSN